MMCTWRYAGFMLAASAAFALTACGKGAASTGAGAPQAESDEIPKGDAGKRMYFEKRCKEGHAGMCGELGLMWARGWGGAKDKAKADEYHKMGCDFAVLDSCKALGIEMTPQQELEILDKKCAAGSAFACNNQGQLLLGADQLVPADPAKARPLLEKGCAAGYGASCRGLAHIWGEGLAVTKDEAKAKEYGAKAEAADAAVRALEAKYFHIPPRDQLPVGHASKAFIDSMKGDPAQDEMNQKAIEAAAKKAAEALGKEKAAEPKE
jgi:TPR repeat protein